jgi:hypothetical protein
MYKIIKLFTVWGDVDLDHLHKWSLEVALGLYCLQLGTLPESVASELGGDCGVIGVVIAQLYRKLYTSCWF